MTVIVGIACQDGIVIGADTSATSVAGQITTVEQPTHKIEILSDRIIVACTGSAGLAQRFGEIVRKALEEENLFSDTNTPIEVGKALCMRGLQDFAQTSPGGRNNPIGFGALVAFPIGRNLHLCEFEPMFFQPEWKRQHEWYLVRVYGRWSNYL